MKQYLPSQHTPWAVALAMFVLAVALAWPAPAASRDLSLQEAVPEWYLTLPPNQPGFPVGVSGSYFYTGSAPTLVDLDGNGTLEIVIAGRTRSGGSPGCGGTVYAYRHNGSLFWEHPVRAAVNSTPTAADLNGDGHPDVIVGMGGYATGQCWDGGVVALDGLTGAELWTFNTQDWLNHNPDGMLDGVFSTPAVGDVDGDGDLEIAFGAWDQCFYLLDNHGTPLWGNLPGILPQTYCGGHGYYNEDTFWSSPAMADLNDDGLLEIITGADVYPGNVYGDPGGGYVYVFDATGNALAREWLDQDVYSSPGVADLDNDGALEIAVGTGTFWEGTGYYVSAYDYNPAGAGPTERLVLKWRSNTDGRVFASPAIGDLDKDGWLDVVVTGSIGDNGGSGSYTYAFRGHDGQQIFRRRNCNYMGDSGNTQASPVIADVDGDTYPEILFSHLWEVEILNHDGTYYTDYTNPQWPGGPIKPGCQRDHAPTTELSYYVEYQLYSTVAVGDLDADGDAEVVVGGHNPSNTAQGMIFAMTGHSNDQAASWPLFHQNERHTGLYLFDRIPPTNPTNLSSPSHTPRQWSTTNVIQVAWSGAGDDRSGVGGYSIAWDSAAGTLPDTRADLPADAAGASSPARADGQNHYFHLRTVDRAGNWTPTAIHLGPFWIDSHAPYSNARSPALATGSFVVSWGGSDGGSGVLDYTVQVKQDGGDWTNWRTNVTDTSATYDDGAAGHTYRFRSIARDRAGLVETRITPEGDAATTVANFLLSGAVYDPQGAPVPAAAVTSVPAALNRPLTDSQGRYTLGLMDDGSVQVTAGVYGLGPLPARAATVGGGEVDLYLPPAANRVSNGDFEAAGGWQLSGPVAPSRSAAAAFTGDYGLHLGELAGGEAATWSAAQSVSIPGQGAPILAWIYRVSGSPQTGDQLTVIVDGPDSDLTQPLSLDATTWTHGWIDVRALAGQTAEVRFELYRDSPTDELLVSLDDVSLGVVPIRFRLPLLFRRY